MTSVPSSPARVDIRIESTRHANERLDDRREQGPRRGCDRQSDPLGADMRRRAPSERGVARAPGSQTIDLRANDAFEERIRGARQFERPEDEARSASTTSTRLRARSVLNRADIGSANLSSSTRSGGSSSGSAAALRHTAAKNEPSACSVSSILRPRRSMALNRVSPAATSSIQRERNASIDAAALTAPAYADGSRAIEIVPPVEKIIRLVTPVLEAKDDFRLNAPAVVECDFDRGADGLRSVNRGVALGRTEQREEIPPVAGSGSRAP